MQLRHSIRPPQRFNDEEFETPYSEVNLRRPKKAIEKPDIIEFNPNHPPAAFPTLDKPRVPGSNDDSIGNNQDESDSEVDFDGISFDDLDNLQASNGPLNPIYLSNMNLIANAGEPSSHTDPFMQDNDLDFDDSDEEYHLPTPLMSNPEWNELPTSLKIEIFSRLLQSHSWSGACRKLGLDTNYQESVEKAWAERDKQIDEEDAMLGKMLAAQLWEVMRVDNSLPNQDSKSLERSLHKKDRKSFRKLRKKQQIEYLMCNSGEIATARRFLANRGLSVRLVGEWCNSIPVTNDRAKTDDDSDYDETPSKPRPVKWDFESPGIRRSETPSDSSSSGGSTTDGNGPSATTVPRIAFINRPKSAASVGSVEKTRHQSDAVNPPTQSSSQPSQPNNLVSLSVGREQAAQIQPTAPPAFVDPFELVDPNPPTDCVSEYPTLAMRNAAVNIPDAPIPVPNPAPVPVTRPAPEKPVQRSLGGTWSYSSAGLNQTRPNVTTRRRRQEKASPNARKDETSFDADEKKAMPGRGSSEERFPFLQPGLNFLPGPQPKRAGSLGVPFLNTIDDLHALTSESEEMSQAASPVLPGDMSEKTDERTITPPTSDTRSTVDTLGSEVTNELDMMDVGTNHDETEEGEMEPDEMVLVPSGPSH